MRIWPYMPQVDVVEGLEWLTSVNRCRSAEYRAPLRLQPRQTLQYGYVMEPEQYGQAKAHAKTLGQQTFYVPVWMDFFHLGKLSAATTTLSVPGFVGSTNPYLAYQTGGRAVVWDSEEHYEEVGIASFGSESIVLSSGLALSYADALIAPLREAQFQQPFDATRGARDSVEASALFQATLTDDLSGLTGLVYPTWKSKPVILDRAVLVSSAQESFERKVEEFDSQTGPNRKAPLYDTADFGRSMSWTTQSRAELFYLRIWLHQTRGQDRSFWMPSWNADVQITDNIGANATEIEIADVDYASNYPSTTNLMISTADGNTRFCTVTGVHTERQGYEVLELESQFGPALSLANIVETCQLTLSRFASDRVEIHHYVGSASATVSAPITEVPL